MGEEHWLLEAVPNRVTAERDVETLADAMRPDRLRASHPFKLAWTAPSEKNQILLTHLADDVRTTAKVSGVERLLKLMRRDAEAFSDFRYELRVAAALARASGQRMLRLAGPDKGPDIEFCSRSGHTCGVACYRARSDPPNVQELRLVSKRLADAAFRTFTFSPLSDSFGLEVVFDAVPVTPADEKVAGDFVYQLLTEARCPPESSAGSIRVRRLPIPDYLFHTGDLRRVRLRFLYAISAFEKARVEGHLADKLAYEEDAWAAAYGGIPLLAIESSDGAGDHGLHPALKPHMENPNATFAGVLLTYYPTNGIENVRWIPRASESLGLHVEYKTARENMETWAGGNLVVSLNREHSREDWDFFQTVAGCGSELVESLHTGTHHVRLPPVEDPSNPTRDPNFQKNLEAAIARIRAKEAEYPRAPERLGRTR